MTGQILKIEDGKVTIGVDDGRMILIPIADVTYLGPKAGDRVRLYRNGNRYAASKIEKSDNGYYQTQQRNQGASYYGTSRQDVKIYNKHFFTWVCTAFLGGIGIDRFLRGQIAAGLLKLFTVGGFGLWWLIDFVIALGKAYGGSYRGIDDFTFLDGKYSI